MNCLSSLKMGWIERRAAHAQNVGRCGRYVTLDILMTVVYFLIFLSFFCCFLWIFEIRSENATISHLSILYVSEALTRPTPLPRRVYYCQASTKRGHEKSAKATVFPRLGHLTPYFDLTPSHQLQVEAAKMNEHQWKDVPVYQSDLFLLVTLLEIMMHICR